MLFAEIARGGMATVHLGRWVGAGGFSKTVAIKALHPQFARDPDFVAMLLDEARVVARIQHPSVIPTLDLIEQDGELFIVMEYVEGITLAQMVRELKQRGERMAPAIALRIVTSVLHGLDAAHQATDASGRPLEIIHRDVSPENILVGVDGYARLIDFGIARALGRATVTRQGVIKGKPSYLAPEQIVDQPLGPYTDVYSTSVVLWQALTGRKLFSGANPAEQVFHILRQPVSPPSVLREGVTSALDRIVLKGLARNPALRWPSAAAMAEAIERHAGPLASHRAVGELVSALGAEVLGNRAELVRAIESAPLDGWDPATGRRVSDAPKDSLPDIPIMVEPLGISDEASRTSLTSEADARPVDREGGLGWASAVGFAVVAAIVALIAAGAAGAFRLREPDAEPNSGASATVEPFSPTPRASASPPPAIEPPPPAMASATSEPAADPAPKPKPRLRARPRRHRFYVPNDI